ncbi:hypothetical protein [Pseudomarimonas salicorniae]|uniref:Type IV pilus biogenesis n=1 Tax=Pseudomarimonas salicorniae TaxID=2933270 RepID=A0ABT0GGW7_9GAMM|nr:hypothetical protein [Lysobacter sp. CAU 1642]MCK7593785.1 hypothetical protein [Lysobacter sp. CAU 1642]
MKYLGLIAAGLLLIVLLATWKLADTPRSLPPVSADRAGLQSQLREADVEVQRTRALKYQLDALALGVYSGTESETALAFVRPRPAIDPDAPVEPRFPEREVSMIYIAHGFERAMIDGVYAGEGDRLPHGGWVKSISPDRVVIVEREGTRTIALDPRVIPGAQEGRP